MDINKILNADYLDILFEGRNKKYGGYDLRKKYRRRATIAGLISILVVGGVFGATLIKFTEKPVAEALPEIKDVSLTEPPPMEPDKPKPPPPSEPPPPVKPTVKFTPPVIKKNEEVKEEDKPEPEKLTEKTVAGPKNVEGSLDPNAIDPGLNPNPGTGKGPVEAGPPADKVFTAVEQMPAPPFDIQKYLSQNIRYPAAAREDNIQGRVILKFVVDKDGSVTNIEIVRDIGGGCGKEAERVVRAMPKWKPGKQNGQPVKVYYTLPVSFKLGD
jgi:periplasmic protein TonB